MSNHVWSIQLNFGGEKIIFRNDSRRLILEIRIIWIRPRHVFINHVWFYVNPRTTKGVILITGIILLRVLLSLESDPLRFPGSKPGLETAQYRSDGSPRDWFSTTHPPGGGVTGTHLQRHTGMCRSKRVHFGGNIPRHVSHFWAKIFLDMGQDSKTWVNFWKISSN